MQRINYAAHNWLILKINNQTVHKHRHLFRGRVVDLGCGPGPYREDIEETAEEYIGVDWKNSQHDQSNVDIFASLVDRFPFADAEVDTVISSQVLEHIPEPQFFLSECHRILKPGGAALLTVPFMWHVHEAPHDFYRYTRHGLQYLFEKSGFTNIEIEEVTGFWQMMVLKFNYHSLRFAPGPLRLFWIPFWWLGQIVSPIMDRLDHHPEETAGYWILARKPDVP